MGYGKCVEDKDWWVGSFSSRRGLGNWLKIWIQGEVSRKEERNRMAIRYIVSDGLNREP